MAKILIIAGLVSHSIDRAIHAPHLLFPGPKTLLDTLVLLPELKNLLDWIAFEMIQRPDWATTFEGRHEMANLIREKVLRDWPEPPEVQ